MADIVWLIRLPLAQLKVPVSVRPALRPPVQLELEPELSQE
jgi:hypothetical protein